MQAMGFLRDGRGEWRRDGGSETPAPAFSTADEAEAALKSGRIKAGDRVTIGGRPAVAE
jgi:hypothetical protein